MQNFDQEAETQKFDRLAESWWHKDGDMRLLHAMHPTRMNFMRMHLDTVFPQGFTDLEALDAGCGGGITAESFARLGFTVHGIDASARLIHIAQRHSAEAGLSIEYTHAELAEYAEMSPHSADVVCAMELIEHVYDTSTFLRALAHIVRPGGLLFLSTINRTLKSRIVGIGIAEYLLRLLPVGTHDWQKFVKPSEIVSALPNFRVLGISGMLPCPDLQTWTLHDRRVQINYIMALQKDSTASGGQES